MIISLPPVIIPPPPPLRCKTWLDRFLSFLFIKTELSDWVGRKLIQFNWKNHFFLIKICLNVIGLWLEYYVTLSPPSSLTIIFPCIDWGSIETCTLCHDIGSIRVWSLAIVTLQKHKIKKKANFRNGPCVSDLFNNHGIPDEQYLQ